MISPTTLLPPCSTSNKFEKVILLKSFSREVCTRREDSKDSQRTTRNYKILDFRLLLLPFIQLLPSVLTDIHTRARGPYVTRVNIVEVVQCHYLSQQPASLHALQPYIVQESMSKFAQLDYHIIFSGFYNPERTSLLSPAGVPHLNVSIKALF